MDPSFLEEFSFHDCLLTEVSFRPGSHYVQFSIELYIEVDNGYRDIQLIFNDVQDIEWLNNKWNFAYNTESSLARLAVLTEGKYSYSLELLENGLAGPSIYNRLSITFGSIEISGIDTLHTYKAQLIRWGEELDERVRKLS